VQGRIITFEGIDGAGKSTQAQILYNYLKNYFDNVILLREPGGTKLGDMVRDILLRENQIEPACSTETFDISITAEFLLFAAARAELVRQVVAPALQEGAVILLDRFIDSSIAYQGYGRGLAIDFIDKVNRAVINGIEPDLTLLFDIAPQAASSRLQRRADRIEAEGLIFLETVRQGYLKIAAAEPQRIRLIDAALEPQTVSSMMFEAVKPLLINFNRIATYV